MARSLVRDFNSWFEGACNLSSFYNNSTAYYAFFFTKHSKKACLNSMYLHFFTFSISKKGSFSHNSAAIFHAFFYMSALKSIIYLHSTSIPLSTTNAAAVSSNPNSSSVCKITFTISDFDFLLLKKSFFSSSISYCSMASWSCFRTGIICWLCWLVSWEK